MLSQKTKTKYLMYHAFSEIEFNRYCMNIEQFKKHEISNNYVVTYDDGSESIFKYSDAIMNKGENQILFISTDKIGRKKYLSSSQIRALGDRFNIQSHSHSHYCHLLLDDNKIRQEGLVSKQIIEDITGKPVNNYAFPGGTWSMRSIKVLSEIGYRNFFTSIPIFFTNELYHNGQILNLHGRVEIYSPGYSTISEYFRAPVISRRVLRHIISYSKSYIKSKLKIY